MDSLSVACLCESLSLLLSVGMDTVLLCHEKSNSSVPVLFANNQVLHVSFKYSLNAHSKMNLSLVNLRLLLFNI